MDQINVVNVMLDQMLRVILMEGLRAVVWAGIFVVAFKSFLKE